MLVMFQSESNLMIDVLLKMIICVHPCIAESSLRELVKLVCPSV